MIGAGAGGLVAARELAAQGVRVELFEKAAGPGGKIRQVRVGDRVLDAGPTVFTMRWVFEELFDAVGASLGERLPLRPLTTLARHAWSGDARLDLFADPERSAEAIGDFAGAAEARRYRRFSDRAQRAYRALERSFIRAATPSMTALARGGGLRGLGELWRLRPFATLWQLLCEDLRDPRLRQLFGRYATYCGSSPFLAPATLALIADVERQGVWQLQGGMHRLAVCLAGLAAERGARLRYRSEVSRVLTRGGRVCGVELGNGERLEADAVVVNADPAALPAGLFGVDCAGVVAAVPTAARSLSALTWNLVAEAKGFPLLHHNVFFSSDYRAEFTDLLQRMRLPHEPTVYVCAQDRGERQPPPDRAEGLLCLVNAPPTGDRGLAREQIARCERQVSALLGRCGLTLIPTDDPPVVTTPGEFERRFPATGGALYGRASHGWRASFARPGSRTRLPGLYLAGGSTHPGPGVPMAALSGRLAAAGVIADLPRR